MVEIEARRLVEQEHPDGLKTLEERSRLGQFAIPPALASDIGHHAVARWQSRLEPVAFLNPALGTGSFDSRLR